MRTIRTLGRLLSRVALLGVVSAAPPAAAGVPAVALSLVQPVPGAPGTAAGWGFTLTNPTGTWIVVTGVTASQELTALGAFTDFAAQHQYVVVPPGGSVTQGFDDVLKTGAGSLLSLLPNASAGGSIAMTYDAYSADPAGGGFDPTASGSSYGNGVSAAATFGTTPVQLQTFEAE